MIRILHAADLHLDSPMQLPSERIGKMLRQEMRSLPEKLRSLTESEGAQLVLLSGDILDAPRCSRETERALTEALRAMSVPVFIAPGNHDPFESGGIWERLDELENVHVFREPKLEMAEVEELGVRVWGAGYRDSICPPLLTDFSLSRSEDALDILLLHAEVGRNDSRYCPVSEEELARSGFDYAALGHIHTYSTPLSAGACLYAWPGCPQGRGFDECGEKGVIVADVGERRKKLRFVSLAQHRFLQFSVPAEPDAAAAVRALLPSDAKEHLVRVTLTGERDEKCDLSALSAQLESECLALFLRDESTQRRDLWVGCGESTLRGLFLEKLRQRMNDAEGEELEQLETALRCGIAALEGGEEPC